MTLLMSFTLLGKPIISQSITTFWQQFLLIFSNFALILTQHSTCLWAQWSFYTLLVCSSFQVRLILALLIEASAVAPASRGDLACIKCNKLRCFGNGVNFLLLHGVFSVQCVILFCKNATHFNRLELLLLIISKLRLGQALSCQQLIPKPFSALASHLLVCPSRMAHADTHTHTLGDMDGAAKSVFEQCELWLMTSTFKKHCNTWLHAALCSSLLTFKCKRSLSPLCSQPSLSLSLFLLFASSLAPYRFRRRRSFLMKGFGTALLTQSSSPSVFACQDGSVHVCQLAAGPTAERHWLPCQPGRVYCCFLLFHSTLFFCKWSVVVKKKQKKNTKFFLLFSFFFSPFSSSSLSSPNSPPSTASDLIR